MLLTLSEKHFHSDFEEKTRKFIEDALDLMDS